MIICRTPFRISFFGGSTDYPEWYRAHGGATLGTAINKYCYIRCRFLPPFFAFLLLFVPPSAQQRVREELSTLIHVPFRFQCGGSRIIFVAPEEDYAAENDHRAIQNLSSFEEIADEKV